MAQGTDQSGGSVGFDFLGASVPIHAGYARYGSTVATADCSIRINGDPEIHTKSKLNKKLHFRA